MTALKVRGASRLGAGVVGAVGADWGRGGHRSVGPHGVHLNREEGKRLDFCFFALWQARLGPASHVPLAFAPHAPKSVLQCTSRVQLVLRCRAVVLLLPWRQPHLIFVSSAFPFCSSSHAVVLWRSSFSACGPGGSVLQARSVQ